jgi:predicted dehydrogenase
MTKTTRRDFLKQSAIAATAVGAVPYFLSSAQPVLAQAPSDRLRMGCIGVGDMGRGIARGFNGLTDIVAVCDVDSLHMEIAQDDNNIGRRRRGTDGDRVRPEGYKDYRRILERDDIDVVTVVTPDHWHTKISIEAMQAGKHVFCEKPLTLTIEESQLIREACKKYNKTFQVGTQQRSQRDQFALATLMVRKGLLGTIERVVCNIGGGPSSAPIPRADVPAQLDFDMWLGPAPLVDYIATPEVNDPNRRDARPRNSRTHFEFRWWYEYSGGIVTDWGAHHVDCALWALDLLDDGVGPTKINPLIAEHPVPFVNGYPTVNNRYNTVTRFDFECTFEEGPALHVVSNSPDGNGILFEGTGGRMHVSRGRIAGRPFELIQDRIREEFPDEEFEKLYHGKRWEGHRENFIRCIREGGLPVSDLYTHVQAMNVCHLCVIAARLGREITWDPKTERTGDAESQRFTAREQRRGYEIPRI